MNDTDMTAVERDIKAMKDNTAMLVSLIANERREKAWSKPTTSGFTDVASEMPAAIYRQTVLRYSDSRLQAANVATWGGEASASAGGFALPPDQRDAIMAPIVGDTSLLGRLKPVPVAGDVLVLAVDEAADWTTSGVDAGIYAEGATTTATKPALKQVRVTMNSARALVHASEELVTRMTPAYSAYLFQRAMVKILNKVEQWVLTGSGMNQPVGLLNSPALVTHSDTASNATTIAAADVAAMVGRLVPGGFANAFWIGHTSILPALSGLSSSIYNSAGPGSPHGTIMGKPLVISEWASPLNSTGDLLLVDPTGYAYGVNAPRLVSTIEFAFDQSLHSFRATFDFGGAPLLSAPVVRRSGSDTLSHVVALAGGRS